MFCAFLAPNATIHMGHKYDEHFINHIYVLVTGQNVVMKVVMLIAIGEMAIQLRHSKFTYDKGIMKPTDTSYVDS